MEIEDEVITVGFGAQLGAACAAIFAVAAVCAFLGAVAELARLVP